MQVLATQSGTNIMTLTYSEPPQANNFLQVSPLFHSSHSQVSIIIIPLFIPDFTRSNIQLDNEVQGKIAESKHEEEEDGRRTNVMQS